MTKDLIIAETLSKGQRYTVHKAVMTEQSKSVILKVAESITDLSGLQNELKILQHCCPEPELLDLINFQGKPALIRRYASGTSLDVLLEKDGHGIDLFNKAALPVLEALESLHKKDIIHRDISPGNIVVDLQTGQAAVIDLELGSLTQQIRNQQYFNSAVGAELLYISPEQTGRMNRAVDYRSDYYSLGMVFYEMLTGKKPYNTDDALELIHCHIARVPEDISVLNPRISPILNSIIKKLFAKQADDRYQSLEGLRADLELYLEGTDELRDEPFQIGRFDIPFRLKVSQQTVGREDELNRLDATLGRIVEGQSAFIEISGYSGVGKTTLAKESLKNITEHRGLYISGKFEKVKGATPYHGWISAFNELAAVLQSESPERQRLFRKSFETQVGELGGVITSFCPRLELFYGKQTTLPALNAREMQNRFFLAINSLLKSLCVEGFPLVVFIDDWQWADDDSIGLLANLVSDSTLERFLIVTALRDNEVDEHHPYRIAINNIRPSLEERMEFLHLTPLTPGDCHQMVSATLKHTAGPIEPLVEVAFEKTQGNPFFLNSFFENIYTRKLLYVSSESRKWDWDIKAIHELHVSDDLAGMIVDKLKWLDTDCYKLLQKAAFFGNRFSLRLLGRLEGQSMSLVHHTLWPAIQNCLVLPSSDQYKFIPDYYADEDIDVEFHFVHDKVQQACYSSYPSDQKSDLHYAIGQVLYSMGQVADFETAVHFLNGRGQTVNEEDVERFYQVFLQSGMKAYSQSAMERSYEYLSMANEIKPIVEVNELCTWIECAFLTVGKEPALELAERALELYQEDPKRFELYETLIKGLESISENKTAVGVSRRALAELGFVLPEKVSKLGIIVKALKAKMALSDKKIRQLTNFPEIEDPQQLALIKILNVSLGPFFLSEEEIYPLIIFKMVTIGSKYGNCPEITAGYSSFALSLSGVMGAWESGYLLGVESLKLVEKYQTYTNIAVCGFAFTGFVQHHKEPVRNLPDEFLRYYRKGIQYGEIIYGNWNLNFGHLYRVLLGHPMEELKTTFNDIVVFNRQYKNSFDDRDLVSLEFLRALTGEDPTRFKAFEELIPHWEENNNPTLNFVWHMLMGIWEWLHANFDRSLKYLQHCATLEDKMVGSFMAQYYLPFVAVLSLYDRNKSSKKLFSSSKKKLIKQQKYYDYNVSWMLAWMEAEQKRVKDGKAHADLFEKAESMAVNAGFSLPAILIKIHRLGRSIEKPKDFATIIPSLIQDLRQMEIEPVARFYEDKYKAHLRLTEKQDSPEQRSGYKLEAGGDIDLMTLVKATDALTGELNLNKLLQNMLSYIMQNTGAQFGCFLLRRENEFQRELALSMDNKGQLQAVESEGMISELVLKQVIHSAEPLIIDKASEEMPYSKESAISVNKVQSLFCLPFVHQTKITGIVYLSNNLMPSVFNDKRIALTKMLAGQIAISIENALLYENMEKLVEDRTELLELEKKKTDNLLLNILPEEVATELKEKGKATARRYETVSVLFTDFEDFTLHSAKLSPEELVNEIDNCYRAFDEIITKHQIEKIKTIGDSYMAVCGLPEKQDDHAQRALRAALEIRDYVDEYNAHGGVFNIRIGIHSGAVIAGIVGSKKFAYDIWGDTVNIASRMEQHGSPGKVNISETTFDLVKDEFNCSFRGELDVKNKGSMKMYFAEFLSEGSRL